jgi:glycosyltransferase involved in cell wall biosynthesis
VSEGSAATRISDDGVEISVVIAVRNDAGGLAETLDHLAAQDLEPSRFEVIIVDDGSDDDTAVIARGRPGVRLFERADSGGSYIARNEGLRHARGRFIAITDAGCRPDPSWLSAGIRELVGDPSDIVAGQIRMPLGPSPTLAAMVDVMKHLDQERYVRSSGTAATANLLAARQTFSEVGGFDERLRSSGDAEWTRRAVGAGHRLRFAPDVVVVHPPRDSVDQLLRKAKRVSEGGRAAARAGLTDAKAPYLDPWSFVPHGSSRGRERLRENGKEPGRFTWWLLLAGQVAFVQAPQAFYALRYDMRVWWRDQRGGLARRGAASR